MFDPYLRKYSSVSLVAYAFATLIYIFLVLSGDSNQIERITAAICTGGLFIVIGDLLSHPYRLSFERYNVSLELSKLYDILFKVPNLDSHTFVWLKLIEDDIKKEKADYKRKILLEKILFYIGIGFTTIGFVLLLLIRDSDRIYAFFEAEQQIITIISFISFFLLALTLVLKDDSAFEIIKKKKETLLEMTHNILCPEKYQKEYNYEQSNVGNNEGSHRKNENNN